MLNKDGKECDIMQNAMENRYKGSDGIHKGLRLFVLYEKSKCSIFLIY